MPQSTSLNIVCDGVWSGGSSRLGGDERLCRTPSRCLPYGYCSASHMAILLTLVGARNHPSRNGEQGRGSEVPKFEAVLGGV